MTHEAHTTPEPTESILALPFVTEAFEHAKETADDAVVAACRGLHMQILRLAAKDRAEQRPTAIARINKKDMDGDERQARRDQIRAWNAEWQNTFDAEHFRRKHALATRKFGRTAYALYNTQYENPYNGQATPNVTLRELLEEHPGDVTQTVKHLMHAGL